jgi:hypothetical protein
MELDEIQAEVVEASESESSGSESRDELMGPGGWRPTIADLTKYKVSNIMDDLPIVHASDTSQLGSHLRIEGGLLRGLAVASESLDTIRSSILVSSPEKRPPTVIYDPPISKGAPTDEGKMNAADRFELLYFRVSPNQSHALSNAISRTPFVGFYGTCLG